MRCIQGKVSVKLTQWRAFNAILTQLKLFFTTLKQFRAETKKIAGNWFAW